MTPPYVVSFIALILLAGCSSQHEEYLESVYGQRSGYGAAESVNGTAVFADMVADAGHHVTTAMALSPRLKKADCIVWFPDDFRPPQAEVIRWLEDWLEAKPNRTLIYVGRDFDAQSWYWQQVEAIAPAGEQPAIHSRAVAAKEAFEAARKIHNGLDTCKWFDINWEEPHRDVKEIDSDEQWTKGVDAAKTSLELNSRLEPCDADFDALLMSGNDVIVSRQNIQGSKLYLVANGSFLLNAVLVNHENRKLAGKLIDAIGSPGKNVVFVESRPDWYNEDDADKSSDKQTSKDSGDPTSKHTKKSERRSSSPFNRRARKDGEEDEGEKKQTSPPIINDESSLGAPSGLEMFGEWPTNWILLHFVALGIIFCFWKLPVFGRPLAPPPAEASDFGKHIASVAALLKRSGDARYARSRIEHYLQMIKKSD